MPKIDITVFECTRCGVQHNANAGALPKGWVPRAGGLHCGDCAAAGHPAPEPRRRPRRASALALLGKADRAKFERAKARARALGRVAA